MRVRPARRRPLRRPTVWTIADVTRERERQENVFQELQHAIDYLDHAPAGFLSADAARQHRLSQRHARRTGSTRISREVGSGGLKLSDIVSGDGASLLIAMPPVRRARCKTEVLDLDFKTRSGRSLPVRLFHKVAFGADGTPGPSRTLVLNRARGEGGRRPQRAAEVRFMRFFHNTPMAIATVDRSGRDRALAMRCSPACSSRSLEGRARTLDPLRPWPSATGRA